MGLKIKENDSHMSCALNWQLRDEMKDSNPTAGNLCACVSTCTESVTKEK